MTLDHFLSLLRKNKTIFIMLNESNLTDKRKSSASLSKMLLKSTQIPPKPHLCNTVKVEKANKCINVKKVNLIHLWTDSKKQLLG